MWGSSGAPGGRPSAALTALLLPWPCFDQEPPVASSTTRCSCTGRPPGPAGAKVQPKLCQPSPVPAAGLHPTQSKGTRVFLLTGTLRGDISNWLHTGQQCQRSCRPLDYTLGHILHESSPPVPLSVSLSPHQLAGLETGPVLLLRGSRSFLSSQ